jgi:hypothetical protein
MVEALTKDVQVGETYLGTVTRLMNFGAFVAVLPGKEGLVHISQLAPQRVERVEDVVKIGDQIMVKVVEIDSQGRINLSRKAVLGGVMARNFIARAFAKTVTAPGPRPPNRGNPPRRPTFRTSMAFDSLAQFVAALRRAGELTEVRARVDPRLEIAEITDRVVKAGGPALLFTDVAGSDYPVLTNQFGTERRMAMAFGAKSIDEVAARVRGIVDLSKPRSLEQGFSKAAAFGSLAFALPRTVKDAAVQQVVEMPANLKSLPVLTTWPLDGGPFVTLPLVITRDPESGVQNVGMYRMQVYDETSTGMHWQRHKQGRAQAAKWGKRVPVAVAIGSDPALTYAATAPLPPVVDEIRLRGLLARAPGAARASQDDRHEGARRRRVRARRLRRQRRPARRGTLRRPHRRLQPGRLLSDLPRAMRHAARESDLRGDRGRQTADGRRLARKSDGTALSSVIADGRARDRGLQPAGRRRLPQPVHRLGPQVVSGASQKGDECALGFGTHDDADALSARGRRRRRRARRPRRRLVRIEQRRPVARLS